MNLGSILKFWSNSASTGAVPLTEPMRLRLSKDCGVSDKTAASLNMVTEVGRYSDRKVTYFRVFDPVAVKAAGVDVHRFTDLDAHKELHLFYGNIEGNGEIILTRPDSVTSRG
ncbi:MAG: hypothetical protein NTZ05_23175 [Chloroflexi bacterium]|nr:hypothetical protein [Chloroflexota bacterium]